MVFDLSVSLRWQDIASAIEAIAAPAARLLLSPGSSYSLIALFVTLSLAAAFTLHARRSRRPVALRVLLRALLPRRLWASASGQTDLAFTVFNISLAMMLFGWAILGQSAVASFAAGALEDAFGPSQPSAMPAAANIAISTVAFFLAYEFAYWLDHFLSHKVPILWRFHKVHHAAESLSLATNFRVHPVDTIVFYNIVALVTGLVAGGVNFGFGTAPAPLEISGTNVILLATAVLLTHLHHSHLWITFGQRWGRWLLSPAHHQIHHSVHPQHFDRNFGNCVAVFDRLFGTLWIPSEQREVTCFGLPESEGGQQGFLRNMMLPFAGAMHRPRRVIIAIARFVRSLTPRVSGPA